jgi:DNA primase
MSLTNISILDVANRLGIVVKKKKALCFAHAEKTPSLSFDDNKGVYYCHGCGARGNVVTLVKAHMNNDSDAAYRWLKLNYSFAGAMEHREVLLQKKIIKQPPERAKKNPSNPQIYQWLIDQTTLSSVAEDYLINVRGFTKNTIQKLQIRDIHSPSSFFEQMKNVWGVEELLKCGLATRDEKKSIIKSIWWDHVLIFPFIDLNERITYLQARRLVYHSGPKYLNLKGVQKPVYNINCLKDLKQGAEIIICEGIPDTITMVEYGFNAIGVLGPSEFDEQTISSLLPFTIYVLPDNDPTGQRLSTRISTAFRKIGKPIKKITLPKNKKDANEFYTSNRRN